MTQSPVWKVPMCTRTCKPITRCPTGYNVNKEHTRCIRNETPLSKKSTWPAEEGGDELESILYSHIKSRNKSRNGDDDLGDDDDFLKSDDDDLLKSDDDDLLKSDDDDLLKSFEADNGGKSALDILKQCTIHDDERECGLDPTCDWTARGCVRKWGSLDDKTYLDRNDKWMSPLGVERQCTIHANQRGCGKDPACNWTASGCVRKFDTFDQKQYRGPFEPRGGWESLGKKRKAANKKKSSVKPTKKKSTKATSTKKNGTRATSTKKKGAKATSTKKNKRKSAVKVTVSKPRK